MQRRWLIALLPLMSVGCSTESGVRVRTADSLVPAASTSSSSVPGSRPSGDDGGGGTGDGARDGAGDELFPSLGNPGIDVQRYDLDLRYDPASDRLTGSVGLDLVLTEDRENLTLDSVGPEIETVAIDGSRVAFQQEREELRIAIPAGIGRGDPLRVDVQYSVTPRPIAAPGGVVSGWFHTDEGSYVLGEPDGTRTWLPCNDHPSDKATYRIALTVPSGETAVANGSLVGHMQVAGGERWVWEESRPMATYLVQVLTGDYEIVDGTGPRGMPLSSAVLRNDRVLMAPYLDTIDDQIIFFEQWFGPYPLDGYGIAMTDSPPGLAMEEQGRSLFSRDDFASGLLGEGQQLLLSHELAHQWFGNAVTPARWRDIWLNESFATYAQWMWLEQVGFGRLEDAAAAALRRREDRSAAEPTAEQLFDYNSYEGGAVVLHALRKEVGDDTFFDILRSWVAEHNGQSLTTEDFVAWAEAVSDRSLTDLFAAWLYADGVPATFPD